MLEDLLFGLGFAVVDEQPFPAFTSHEINQCATATAAFEIAKRLRDTLTGVAKADPKFALGSDIDYSTNPPRRHTYIEVQPATLRFSG